MIKYFLNVTFQSLRLSIIFKRIFDLFLFQTSTWSCPSGHKLENLQVCRYGIPDNCPKCSFENIEHFGQQLTPENLLTKYPLPAELKTAASTTTLLPFQNHFETFQENQSVIVNNFQLIMTTKNPWSHPLFRPYMQRCFVILNKKQVLEFL